MPQEQRQKLLSALKDWFLFETGVTQAINKVKEEIMSEFSTEFSRYQEAVNKNLLGVLDLCVEEKAVQANLLQAAKIQDQQQVDAAIKELAVKSQQIADTLAGTITTTPSPIVPTPIPEVSSGMIPPLVIPEVASNTSATVAVDPPKLTIEPSPSGVGVTGGSSISAA